MQYKKKYQIFHEESNIEGRRMDKTNWSDPSLWPKEWIDIAEKTYPRFKKIPLISDEMEITMNLNEVLHSRSSKRVNSNKSLNLKELSTILRNAVSFKKNNTNEINIARRMYPSAGARFPLECYLISLNVEGLENGLYHYELREDSLAQIMDNAVEDHVKGIFGHDFSQSKAILVITSAMERNTIKYGERGYRFALIEAGHVMQNICLLCTSLNIPITPVGGFADMKLTRLLELDDTDEIPIYTCVFP